MYQHFIELINITRETHIVFVSNSNCSRNEMLRKTVHNTTSTTPGRENRVDV